MDAMSTLFVILLDWKFNVRDAPLIEALVRVDCMMNVLYVVIGCETNNSDENYIIYV